MDSQALVNEVMNDRGYHNAVTFALRHMRRTVDATASHIARANTEWHDDLDAEDHAAYHAPAEVQFPRDVRDAAILDMVKHYLTEMTLSEKAKA